MRLLVALLLVVACTPTPPPPAPVPVDHYARASFDSPWNAVIEFFADSRVSIETIDKASGLIVSRQFTIPKERIREWVVCETHSMGTPMVEHPNLQVVADFNVLVRPRGDSTAVRINAVTTGRVVAGTLTSNVECNSSGRFEAMLYERIGARQGST